MKMLKRSLKNEMVHIFCVISLLPTLLTAAPKTYKVSTTSDTPPLGVPGELRYAMLQSNSNPVAPGEHNNIHFTVFGTINITAASLPPITEPVHIDGYTAPFAKPNTNDIHDPAGNNAQITVEIRGPGAGVNLPVLNGFTLSIGSSGSIISGLAINSFANFDISTGVLMGAIAIEIDSDDNRIEGNFIGTVYERYHTAN